MVTVAEALNRILALVPSLPPETIPLSRAAGRFLADAVTADRPLPPFDRAMLDGIAIAHAALASGNRTFRIERFQAAGQHSPPLADASEGAVEIATGAPVPPGADTVIGYEDLLVADGFARLRETARTPTRGSAVHPQGSDTPAGATLLPPGARLGPVELGIAASVGAVRLRVAARPRIAVVATGDELVPPSRRPATHQIRRSNDVVLAAILAPNASVRTHAWRDRLPSLRARLRHAIEDHAAVVLTGGISQGRLDLLPQVLADLPVELAFRGVAQRPGKPFAFGIARRSDGTPVPIFALPGNPVSAAVGAVRYVRPALARMCGAPFPVTTTAILADALDVGTPLNLFVPAALHVGDDARLLARPRPTNSSGDLVGLAGTDGFVDAGTGPTRRLPGEPLRFHRWQLP